MCEGNSKVLIKMNEFIKQKHDDMTNQDWAYLVKIVKDSQKENNIDLKTRRQKSREQNLKEAKETTLKMQSGRIANNIYGLPKIPETKHESASKNAIPSPRYNQ